MKMKALMIFFVSYFFLNGCVTSPDSDMNSITPAMYQAAENHYKNEKECLICNRGAARFGDKMDVDSIGVVNLHTGDIWDIEFYIYDKAGKIIDNSGAITTSYNPGKDAGSSVKLSVTGGRGVCELDISLNENSVLDMDKASEALCDSCMEKIKEMDEDLGELLQPEDRLDVVLYDFKEKAFYSLNKINKMYFIRDYLVHIDYRKEKETVLIVHTPNRTKMGAGQYF